MSTSLSLIISFIIFTESNCNCKLQYLIRQYFNLSWKWVLWIWCIYSRKFLYVRARTRVYYIARYIPVMLHSNQWKLSVGARKDLQLVVQRFILKPLYDANAVFDEHKQPRTLIDGYRDRCITDKVLGVRSREIDVRAFARLVMTVYVDRWNDKIKALSIINYNISGLRNSWAQMQFKEENAYSFRLSANSVRSDAIAIIAVELLEKILNEFVLCFFFFFFAEENSEFCV
jgi:hypothetical protein